MVARVRAESHKLGRRLWDYTGFDAPAVDSRRLLAMEAGSC
jgi:hypothetical protein